MTELGGLLYAKALHQEAEPLLRRAFAMFLSFRRNTGHEHPHLRAAIRNYAALLTETGLQPEQMQARLKDLCREYGITLEASA